MELGRPEKGGLHIEEQLPGSCAKQDSSQRLTRLWIIVIIIFCKFLRVTLVL
jgi:hypothetical protein